MVKRRKIKIILEKVDRLEISTRLTRKRNSSEDLPLSPRRVSRKTSRDWMRSALSMTRRRL